MNNQPIKTQLIDLLHEARTVHQQFIDSLTEAERNKPGQPDLWSAKDIMSHLTFWEDILVQRLDAASRGEQLPDLGDDDTVNLKNFEAHRNDSWQQITDWINRTFDALIAKVQEFSEAELTDPNHYEWQQGRPLLRSVISSAYSHPQTHFADFMLKAGNMDRATQMQEMLAEKISGFGNGMERGTAIYNLACFYALVGQSQKALSLVTEALRLEPSLIAWSKQDPDLVSLREEPAFKAF